MAHTLTFALSPSQYAARVTELAGDGVTISGNTGTLEYKGVDVAYNYDGSAVLTVSIVKKPWYDPESAVEDVITNWFHN